MLFAVKAVKENYPIFRELEETFQLQQLQIIKSHLFYRVWKVDQEFFKGSLDQQQQSWGAGKKIQGTPQTY
jgi:hypothetical protein